MLLILYLYFWIVIARATRRNNEKFEKLKREVTQLQLDADRMMREIADSFQTKRVKSNAEFAEKTGITHVFGVPLTRRNAYVDKPGYGPANTIEELELLKEAAVLAQDFVRAAELRDKIKSLKRQCVKNVTIR